MSEDQTQAQPAAAPGAPLGSPSGDSKADAAKAKAKAIMGSIAGIFKGGLGNIGKAAGGVGSGIGGVISGIFKVPASLVSGIFTGSLFTKLISLGFLASLGVLGYSGFEIYNKFLKPMLPQKAATVVASTTSAGSGINALAKLQREQSIAINKLVFMDRFSAAMHGGRMDSKAYELEFAMECDDPETARFIKTKLVDFREAVSIALQGGDYDDLITDDGKEKLKKRIAHAVAERLKHHKIKGHIYKIHFTRFVMG